MRLADAFSRPVRVIAFSIAIFGGCFLDRIESFGNAVGWALDQRSRMHGSHSAAVAGAARPNRWLIPYGCSALATGYMSVRIRRSGPNFAPRLWNLALLELF